MTTINDALGNATSNGSMTKPWADHPLLARPLYAFDLPATFVSSLELRSIDVTARENDVDTEQGSNAGTKVSAPQQAQSSRQPDTNACSICPGAPVPKGAPQVRAHLRSDWHRYNAALSRRGQKDETLSEENFHRLVEELSSDEESDGSAAGASDASKEDRSEKAPSDPVATLLSRMRKMSMNDESDVTDEEIGRESMTRQAVHSVARDSHLWFRTRQGSQNAIPQTQIGVLRFLFPDVEADIVPKNWYANTLARLQPGNLTESAIRGAKRLKGAAAADEAATTLGATFVDASGDGSGIGEDDSDGETNSARGLETEETINLKDSQSTVANSTSTDSSMISTNSPTRTWTFILLGGGDFAAITIALNPYNRIISQKKGTTERQFLVIARKQFHRYTTRRKQGGSQAAQDASGRFAKSAGAQLRRYGEQQLSEEIRELLDTPNWRTAIQSSERIWVRAGLRSARGVLWSWPTSNRGESPIDDMRRQDKVYSIPIATRKPTVGECLRCFSEMTRVRIRHETEEEMQRRDAMYRAQLDGAVRAKLERQEQRRQRQAERKQRESAAFAAAAKGKSGKAKRKLDAAEQLRRERLVRLVDMLRKGRLQNAVAHLEKYETEMLSTAEERAAGEPDDADEAAAASQKRVNAVLPEWWRDMDAKRRGIEIKADADADTQVTFLSNKQNLVPATLLQVAAEGGHGDVVNYFLVERRADPCIGIPPPPATAQDDPGENTEMQDKSNSLHTEISLKFPHRTAYDLCSTREARDAFRRLMAAQPDWVHSWSGMDKGGARVPKALTGEMEEARNKEEEVRDRRSQMRERARQRQHDAEVAKAHTITDEDRLGVTNREGNTAESASSAQQSAAASHPTSNRLGGPAGKSAPRALQKQRDDASGLTPEMRQRIEREKRARAAEARIKAMKEQQQQPQ